MLIDGWYLHAHADRNFLYAETALTEIKCRVLGFVFVIYFLGFRYIPSLLLL